ATDISFATGRSNVIIPSQAAVGVPAAPGGNNPPPADAQATVAGTDIDWVTVSYKVPVAELAREFQRTNVPPKFTTCFLDVDLMRQEQQPDGSWGAETVCPKLTTSTQPPFPPANAPPKQAQPYLNWAVGAVAEIVQPTFYNITKGDAWTLSKDLVPQNAAAVAAGDNNAAAMNLGPNDTRPGFDPATYVSMTPQALAAVTPPLTNKEKQMVAQAKQEAAAKAQQEKARSAPPPPTRAPTGGRGGPPGGYRGARAIQDDARPMGRDLSRVMGDATDATPVAPPQPPQNFSQLFPPLPQNEFDPRDPAVATAPAGSANAGMIVGWAHDTKAEPGKVYRYAIRYQIKSPVWGTTNVTKVKQMADTFAITSALSAWTGPVKVPSIVSFFVLDSHSPARIEIFRWQNGQTHKETFNVSPGDSIGMTKGTVDFSTGFTLVAFRGDSLNNTVAWLLNPDGVLVKHDVKEDQNSPEKQELERQSGAATPAGAQAAAGAPTGAPGAGPTGAPAMINPTR
ncbi:MAG TPA: hypothetical protein VHS31_10575, partial [Tepidisphaeraceae bacterium]|nr:hypothetical protein [Tepidisphaeraceae bacterium]